MDKGSGSKLMQMQARFQQKQMAEREMKIASLYEAQQARALGRVRQSPTTNGQSTNGVVTSHSSPPAHAPVPPGKVRQMFEERRTKAGIDKSYPLQPIHNTDRTAPRRTVNQSKVTSTSTSKFSSNEKKTSKTIVRQTNVIKQKTDSLPNGVSDVNHNHKPDLNGNKRLNGHGDGIDEIDHGVSNYNIDDETFPDALAPLATPRTPRRNSPEPVRPPRRSPQVKNNVTTAAATSNPTPARRATPENNAAEKSKGVMQRGTKPITKKSTNLSSSNVKSKSVSSPVTSPNKNGPNSCSMCGRTFAEDRLQKHETICRKTNGGKKRKPFDVLKHRLAGTEAEPFITKIRKSTTASAPPAQKKLNGNWRQKHEEFIAAIRAAKQVQAHIKSGGKLSDLPPPPPSENPDYVQCPHCSRRFNQGAAERHIPKCANYQFNKPKPQAKRR